MIKSSEPVESIFSEININFYKTNNNKKVIGRINDFIYMLKVHFFHKYQNLSEMRIVYENGLINNTPTGKLYEAKKSWSSPIENLNEMINPAQNQ